MLKLAYLAGYCVALVGALLQGPLWQHGRTLRIVRPIIIGSITFAVFVVVSLLVATLNGTSTVDWLRGAASYLMVAGAPVFALDAYHSMSHQARIRLFVAAGLTSAVGFGLTWLSQRHIVNFMSDQVVLSSVLLPTALFAYALSASFHGTRRRWAWMLLAVVIAFCMLVTGTRSMLLLLLCPIAVLVAGRSDSSVRFFRLVVVVGASTLLLVLSASLLGRFGADTTRLMDRFSMLQQLAVDPQSDVSLLQRLVATRVAWTQFIQAPLMGRGPGFVFDLSGESVFQAGGVTRNLDTPVLLLAKFGLAGLLVTGGLGYSYVLSWKKLRAQRVNELGQYGLVGFGIMVAAFSSLLLPFEDKGFSLAVMLLLSASLPGEDDARPERVGEVT